MPRPTSARRPRPADPSAGPIAERLRAALARAPLDQPLPTTRELGERFRVANTTVFRILQQFARTGEVWQHPVNGRYYPPAARALLDRPKPVACVIRRLEVASELYRELLEGISAGCGALRRTMLLWHDELLVNHPVPARPPAFARLPQQTAILRDFLERHGADAGGFILDHVWYDEALRTELARLRPAVVLFRTCALPEIGNVRADFQAGAFKALGYLLGRGYTRIVPIVPFHGDPAVDEFGAALQSVAAELACRDRLLPPVLAGATVELDALLPRLKRGHQRVALVCPEDNVSLQLLARVQSAGLSCPGEVGVLSVMGTDFAVRAGLTCLRYDFRRLGAAAVKALTEPAPLRAVIDPVLVAGQST